MRAECIAGRAKGNVQTEEAAGTVSRWICLEQRLFLGNRKLRVERLAGPECIVLGGMNVSLELKILESIAWDKDLPKQFFISLLLNPEIQ